VSFGDTWRIPRVGADPSTRGLLDMLTSNLTKGVQCATDHVIKSKMILKITRGENIDEKCHKVGGNDKDVTDVS
jgi:hypothetical protein